MSYLVCGNGPSLPGQLKDKDLSGYTVVRVNNWQPIEGVSSKCDIWVCYPLNHIGEKEAAYDFTPYFKQDCEIWVPHVWTYEVANRILPEGRGYRVLSAVPFLSLLGEFCPNAPNTGTWAIFMAMVMTKFKETITIAGFDHYEGDKEYYYSNMPMSISPIHSPKKDKVWIETMIKIGRINVL